jgi:hypothetical protein
MQSSVFCYTTPCCPEKINRRFGGTYRFPSSASNIKPSNKPAETGGKLSSAGFASFFLGFLFNRDEGGDMFLRNVVDLLRARRYYMTADRTLHDRFLVN